MTAPRLPIDGLIALSLASALAPPTPRPYGSRPVEKSISRAERDRRKAKKKAAKAARRRNRP